MKKGLVRKAEGGHEFVCMDKHSSKERIHSSDNAEIRYFEKIRLCPTKHPTPAMPNMSASFYSVCSVAMATGSSRCFKTKLINSLGPQISSVLLTMPP